MEKFFDYSAQVVEWNWENWFTRFTVGWQWWMVYSILCWRWSST